MLYHKGVDEQRALAEARRVLKPGGHILITDCAIPWLWSNHDEAMGAKRRYYKHELEQLVKEAGFTIRRSSYIFFATFLLFVAVRLLARIIPALPASLPAGTAGGPPKHFVSMPHPVVNRILIALLGVEATLLRWVNFQVGSSVLVFGQKA